ncbi:MAG TPA: ATP-binding cassette domain-containing protein, partial [Streptosporangiaceae bacterium]
MLTLDGVFAGYGGGDVLKGVDLTVTEGSITCVVGPNGAGKSTLLKVVSGLINPRAGRVLFRDRDLTHAPPRKIVLSGIVQVIQSRGIFPEMTVRENVEIGAFVVKDRALV